MKSLESTKSLVCGQLTELIAEGYELHITRRTVVTGRSFDGRPPPTSTIAEADPAAFMEWRTSSLAVLDRAIPKQSALRPYVDQVAGMRNSEGQISGLVAFMKGALRAIEDGLLDDLAAEVEGEILTDFLNEAEDYLKGTADKYSYGAAAVLIGATLERALRTMCQDLEPPEDIVKNGKRLGIGPLNDALKKRSAYGGTVHKQVIAWASIRNSAAHGHFDEFNAQQVKSMASDVTNFIARYVS